MRTEAVRYFSVMNPWIDFIVVYNADRYSKSLIFEAVDNAMNMFWNCDENTPETYGDCLDVAFNDLDIQNQVVLYHDIENENEEYEDIWDDIVSSLHAVTTTKE